MTHSLTFCHYCTRAAICADDMVGEPICAPCGVAVVAHGGGTCNNCWTSLSYSHTSGQAVHACNDSEECPDVFCWWRGEAIIHCTEIGMPLERETPICVVLEEVSYSGEDCNVAIMAALCRTLGIIDTAGPAAMIAALVADGFVDTVNSIIGAMVSAAECVGFIVDDADHCYGGGEFRIGRLVEA